MYSNELICNILTFLDTNINRRIEISELTSRFYYDRYYIMKLFKKELGITITKYINQVRIYNSILDIRSNSYSLTRIALKNGFTSLEYFSETFKQIMKVSPRIYQNYHLYRNKISEKDVYNIRDNLINLYDFLEKIKKYKTNRKPNTNPVLKRTIFK